MGAYVSTSECKRHYKIDINCKYNFTLPRSETFIGDHLFGEVPADGDVAGIGIVSMFVGVTCFALVLSILDLVWRLFLVLGWRHEPNETEKREKLDRSCGAFDIGRVFESVVVSCSDQQIFTGGAYAITLRFYKGCSVTAYHYNIIAKMLLLTCATHLLSVAVVRHYWRYPLLAGIRVAVITGVFVVTGLLLGNQNATNRIPFPSEVPPLKQPDSYLLMSAACFQASNSPFIRTFTTSFKDEEHAKKAFLEARPGNKIEGWNFYLFILFCYGAAILVEIGKMVVRSNQRKQFFNMSQGLKSTFLSGKSGSLIRGLSRFAYGLYLAACVAISGVTIGFQVTQLFGLRRWARRSGWLETNEGGLSEEDDWSTFGQLVPMFLGLLTLFTFVENISRKFPAFACTNGSTDNIARNVQQTKQTDGDRRPR